MLTKKKPQIAKYIYKSIIFKLIQDTRIVTNDELIIFNQHKFHNLRCDVPVAGKYITVQRMQESGTAELHIAEINFKFLYTDFRKSGGCSIKVGIPGRPLNCPSQKDNLIQNLKDG